MMGCAALKIAVDLVHVPSQVRLSRLAPLPEGIPMLLQIAAGDEQATHDAVRATGRSRDVVRDAAAFFIEQVLFCPEADSYRVLGTNPTASSGELRRNMALLLRWLHPDLDPQGERSIFASKVTLAWNDLKTQEKRAAYDALRRVSLAKKSRLPKKNRAGQRSKKHNRLIAGGSQQRRQGAPDRSVHIYRDERSGILHRLLLFLFGGVKN
jgi:hypothetical protein